MFSQFVKKKKLKRTQTPQSNILLYQFTSKFFNNFRFFIQNFVPLIHQLQLIDIVDKFGKEKTQTLNFLADLCFIVIYFMLFFLWILKIVFVYLVSELVCWCQNILFSPMTDNNFTINFINNFYHMYWKTKQTL